MSGLIRLIGIFDEQINFGIAGSAESILHGSGGFNGHLAFDDFPSFSVKSHLASSENQAAECYRMTILRCHPVTPPFKDGGGRDLHACGPSLSRRSMYWP